MDVRSRITSSLNAFVLTRAAGFLFVLFETHSQMFFLSSLITSTSHSPHLQPRVTTWTFFITRNNETKVGDNKFWLEEEKYQFKLLTTWFNRCYKQFIMNQRWKTISTNHCEFIVYSLCILFKSIGSDKQ